MPEKSNLAGKLAQLMGETETIPENGYNEHFKYAFARDADIKREVRKRMAALGLAMITSVEKVEKQGDLTSIITKHTIIDSESGERIEFNSAGQGLDRGDKGIYKAHTGSTKYAIRQLLLLPTGDDPENDDEAKPNGNGKPARNGTPRNGKKPAAPPEPPPTPSRAPDKSTPAQQAEIRKLAKDLDIKDIPPFLTSLGMKSPISKEEAEKVIRILNERKLNAVPTNGKL